jgi:AraC-like DNA-binding protein
MEILVRPARLDLYRRLDRARDVMESAFEQRLPLAEVAAAAYFSKFHFLRAFSDVFECTPGQYLTKLRLRRAKYLLSHTGLAVTEVCFAVGFESLGSFSTLFRREIGESPSQYRARHRHIFALAVHRPEIVIPHCFLAAFGQP